MKIRSLILLIISNFFDTLLNNLTRLGDNREMILNRFENDESISDLHIVLGAQQRHDRFGHLEMPLVANMTEVLVADVIICVGAL